MLDDKTLLFLKLSAIKAIEDPTWEDYYRVICRWYSKTFHTPLHIVINELSEFDVIKTYYEEILYSMANASDNETQQEYKKYRDDLLFNTEEEDEWITKVLNEEVAIHHYNDDHNDQNESPPLILHDTE